MNTGEGFVPPATRAAQVQSIYLADNSSSSSSSLSSVSNCPKDIAGLPQEKWWMLFVEGKHHMYCRDAYESGATGKKSPGFADAMERALEKFLVPKGRFKWDYDSYCAMHDSVVDRVFREKMEGGDMNAQGYEPVPNEKSGRGTIVPLSVGKRKRGITELMKDGTVGESGSGCPVLWGKVTDLAPEWEDADKATGGQLNVLSSNYDKNEGRKLANAAFDEYAKNPGTTPNDQLRAIVRLVRQLHVLHLFTDGNRRLNPVIVLNRLLLDAGFNPIMLDNTVIFRGDAALDYLVNSVVTGMTLFDRAVAGSYNPCQAGARNAPTLTQAAPNQGSGNAAPENEAIAAPRFHSDPEDHITFQYVPDDDDDE